MDPIRRNIVGTGVAAATMAAAPQVFAQQTGQGGTAKFYEKAPFASVIKKPVRVSRCC